MIRVIDNASEGGVYSVFLHHDAWPGITFRLTYAMASFTLSGVDIADARVAPSGAALLPKDVPLTQEDWPTAPVALTRRKLQQVPLGELDRAARTHMIDRFGRLDPDFVEPLRASTRVGRRGHDDSFYAPIALRYYELLDTGQPVQQLANEIPAAVSTVGNWIRECRARGLLTDAVPGQAGGAPTQKCLACLDEAGLLEAAPASNDDTVSVSASRTATKEPRNRKAPTTRRESSRGKR